MNPNDDREALGESYLGEGELFNDTEGGFGMTEDGFDLEGDQFVGRLIRRAAGAVRRAAPLLKRLAPVAMKAVGSAVPGLNVATSLLGEDESYDSEDGFDGEGDGFAPDGETGLLAEAEDENVVLAETMLAEASRAATDLEAAALAGGITITITGPAPIAVRRVAPVLARGTGNLVRVLHRNPATRPLVPVAGSILRKTTRDLTRAADAGRPITPATAARTMARNTARALAKPSRVAKAVVRNAAAARRLNTSAINRAER